MRRRRSILHIVCSLKHPWSSPKKFPVSMLPKVVFRSKFAQDHESGLRSDRRPVVLCDFSKLRFGKSPYDFLNLYGRFCPYNPPYNPGHDTLPPNLHIEIFTQRKKTRRKSIEFSELYRLTSRKPGLEISFRMQIWWQWVNKNDFPLRSKRTVATAARSKVSHTRHLITLVLLILLAITQFSKYIRTTGY